MNEFKFRAIRFGFKILFIFSLLINITLFLESYICGIIFLVSTFSAYKLMLINNKLIKRYFLLSFTYVLFMIIAFKISPKYIKNKDVEIIKLDEDCLKTLYNFQVNWANIQVEKEKEISAKFVKNECDTIFFIHTEKILDKKKVLNLENKLEKEYEKALCLVADSIYCNFKSKITILSKSSFQQTDSKEVTNNQKIFQKHFKGFNSANWYLEQYILSKMIHPKTYKHIQTNYHFSDKKIVVHTKFQGKSTYFGYKEVYAISEIDSIGNIISFYGNCKQLFDVIN